MLTVNIEVDVRQIKRAMASLTVAVREMTPVMERTASKLLTSAQQNFTQESARVPVKGHAEPGGFWADLAESTKAQRTKQGTWPGKKLQRTGRLLASLEKNAGATTAEVGTTVEYGKYLQLGTRKMVARPFLALQQSEGDELLRAVEAHLRAAIAARQS
jgi:phage virion morphogenesis protein